MISVIILEFKNDSILEIDIKKCEMKDKSYGTGLLEKNLRWLYSKIQIQWESENMKNDRQFAVYTKGING